jgi:mono/diheme cytochrome c family protein
MRNTGSPGGTSNDLSANGSCNCYIACVMCHGLDGLTPTQIGLSLYPPTPSLGTPEVQRYTDPELFWVVKNGIRLTGMPGFGRIYSDQQIWDLVRYMRTLKASSNTPR